MNTIQIINDIKKALLDFNNKNEFIIQDLDFLTSKFSNLENISKKEEFDFSFQSVNQILEKCYLEKSISQHIFTLRREVISIENAFSDNPLFQKEINAQVQKIDAIDDSTDIYTLSEILKVLKLFMPILRNKNESLAKTITSNIDKTENFIKEQDINDANLHKIKANFITIKDTINKYFQENPNAKKIALGAGAVALGALGFIVGKEIYKTFRKPKIAINNNTLIVAYYLSRFDHTDLFDEYIPASQAFEVIAKALDVKKNTLRNMRDYFDFIITDKRTSRKGYSSSKIPQKYYDFQNEYSEKLEYEIKKEVLQILNNTIPIQN